jgi:hypothetical protein
MKTLRILICISFILSSVFANAETIEITFNVSNYYGSNVTCHGASNGSINATIVGGAIPYTYLWSNSATTEDLSSLAAGNYTLTVTDNNGLSATNSVQLLEPNTLQLSLQAYQYAGGTNISAYGLSNGSINAQVSGGTTPYQFLWSNNGTMPQIQNLAAGNYSLTVTDMNGCTASDSKTLTQPALFQISSLTSPLHIGYEVSCATANDGAINLQVAGGVSPYTYQWNNGTVIQNPTGLSKGIYYVTITDRNGTTIFGNIELHAPLPITIGLTPYVYPNNYNLSCYECGNGRLTATPAGGVGSYSYNWLHPPALPDPVGQGTSIISSLIATNYGLIVTDANGCTSSTDKTLNQPNKNTWGMQGDLATNPPTQFIGTTDNKGFVIKTNNESRIIVSENGNVTIPHLTVDSLDINATHVETDTLTVKHITDTLMVARIMPLPGDSLIHVGDSSLIFQPGYNRWFGNPDAGAYRGTGIGKGTSPLGISSIAIGENAESQGAHSLSLGMNSRSPAEGSISIGTRYGVALRNEIPFSLMIGMNTHGTRPTLFVGPANGDLNSIGKVGIGTTNVNCSSCAGYNLFVVGGIRTEKLKIDLASSNFWNWPDYVFDKSYSLKNLNDDLNDVETYIIEHKHLENIPSKEEVKRDGLDLGEFNAKLLAKVEELTLYVIQLKKENDKIKDEISKIKK